LGKDEKKKWREKAVAGVGRTNEKTRGETWK
jgi:hypothetical protein